MTSGCGRRPKGNPYAHLISGLKIIVDVNTLEVLEIEGHRRDYGLPRSMANTIRRYAAHRSAPSMQAAGDQPARRCLSSPSTIELRWQNWWMQLGFNYREGPVIYRGCLRQSGNQARCRTSRMSFAEMVVPYRDPGFDHYRRTAFDIGEWGLGYMVTSLELGCDCLGEMYLRRRGDA